MSAPRPPVFDPYAVLGVAASAEFDVVKAAYRRLVRENHPDVARDKNGATQRMTQINAAWSVIGEPTKRAAFDARRALEAREVQERAAREREMRARPTTAPPTPPRAPRPGVSAASGAVKNSAARPRSAADKKTVRAATKNARRPTAMNNATRLAQAANLLYRANAPEDAISVCRAILKSDFRSVPAREIMGEAYLRLNQPQRACAIWEQALILKPDNGPLSKRWNMVRAGLSVTDSQAPGAATNAIPTVSAVVRPMTPSARPSLPKRLGARFQRRK